MPRRRVPSCKEDQARILIIDQDSASVNALSSILRRRKFDVRAASGVSQALRCVRLEEPALILLAPRVAGGDGLDLARRLREGKKSGRIPLLLIAGRADAAARLAGFKLGIMDTIGKPFREDEIIPRVRAYLELGRLRRTVADPPDQDVWLRFALQAGQMSAFEWQPPRDGVHRSHTVIARAGGIEDGRNWFRRIHPGDLPRYLRVISLLSPTYNTYDTHYRLFNGDGGVIHLRESARAFFDASGRLSRLAGIVCDITGQEQSAHARRHSGTEALLEKAPIPMVLADERGVIRYVNDRFVQDFGYSLREVARPDVWWKRAFREEAQRQQIMRAWKDSALPERRGSEHAPAARYRFTCKDGTTRVVEIFGAAVGDRRLIFFDDVTGRTPVEAALFESEERFRVMADTAPVMIWVAGADRRCTFLNKAWLKYTGRTLREELANGWCSSGVHPDDLELRLSTYHKAFDAREPFHVEYRLRRADGEYRWIMDRGAPRFAADGVFAGYIGSATDITELRRSQEQMVETQKFESLGVMASGIAHDLNNVLGCILAYADIVAVDLDNGSPPRESLRKIETLAMRGTEIVGQIMAYAGREGLRKEPLDLALLVKEMLALLRISLPKGGRLQMDLGADLPLLYGNAAQIRQVVMNLVLNAAESLQDQKGVISIRARRKRLGAARGENRASLPQGDYLCLQVSDTGIGMTEAVRARIFDPFYTTKVAGRGLGLAAVLGIVVDHGGSIDVSSAPGKGSTFAVLFPSAETAEARNRAAGAQFVEPGKRAILVVENEEALRVAVSGMLRARGFPVIEARNASMAVEIIRAEHRNIGVVLLDLAFPGEAGRQLVEEVRRMRPGVKVILTSAASREIVAQSVPGMESGAFIRKPYGLSELMMAVRDALPPESTAA